MNHMMNPSTSFLIPVGVTVSKFYTDTLPMTTSFMNRQENPSLINFIPSSKTGSLRDTLIEDTLNIEEAFGEALPPSEVQREDERCQELFRAFKDIAGPWMTHRFKMEAWDTPKIKQTQEEDVQDFDGVVTKKMIARHSCRLDRCPEFQRYAYTKCVLTNKKISNIDALGNYQYLQYIDLSSNKLTTLKPLGNLPFLKILDASHNCLTTILDFKAPFFLTVVNLSHNKIKSMRDLSAFWSITDLNLSHNLIRVIDGLQALRYLNTLNLSFNRIEVIENLSGLRIQFLYLQNNAIKDKDEKADLDTLKNIRVINLSYNQVSSLKMFEAVKNLEMLDIVNNNVSMLLDIYYLKQLKYLTKLNLTGNPVTNVGRYLEVCVTHIKSLVLLDNEPLNSDYWLRKISYETKNFNQTASQNRLKLVILEQLKPPQLWTWLPPYEDPPIAVVILVGLQTTRRSHIAKKFSESTKNVVIGIQHTTKPKHANEMDGEYFHYVDEETFKEMLKNGDFLTYQENLGYNYGISHSEFKKAENGILMFSADLTMALTIRRQFLNTILVLALPSTKQAHLEMLNLLYAVQVLDDGTLKILNCPLTAAQYQSEFDKVRVRHLSLQVEEVVKDIVRKAFDMSIDEDSQSSSRKSEKSDIVQLWFSPSRRTGTSICVPPIQENDASDHLKRYVSFTVAHVHKIYDNREEKGSQQSGSPQLIACPLAVTNLFTESECYADMLTHDVRIKELFDEELRVREELLDLHLDTPGLFRELLFTDEEDETMSKLNELTKQICRYNETTRQTILSFEKDKSFNFITKNRLEQCFLEMKKEVSISEKQAAEYHVPTYPYLCKKTLCDNPSCSPWRND